MAVGGPVLISIRLIRSRTGPIASPTGLIVSRSRRIRSRTGRVVSRTGPIQILIARLRAAMRGLGVVTWPIDAAAAAVPSTICFPGSVDRPPHISNWLTRDPPVRRGFINDTKGVSQTRLGKEAIMAIKGNSLSEKFSRWQVLVNNLKESVALPNLDHAIAELEGMLSQARALQDRYEDLRTQAREVRAALAQLGRRGDKARGRLGAHLRGTFGYTSESLHRYGFKPNAVTRRRSKAAIAQAKAAAQAATSAAAEDL